jgi:hypothetical protein
VGAAKAAEAEAQAAQARSVRAMEQQLGELRVAVHESVGREGEALNKEAAEAIGDRD